MGCHHPEYDAFAPAYAVIAVKRDIWQAEEDFERRQAGLSEKVLYMEGRIAALEEETAALRYQLDQITSQLSSLDTGLSYCENPRPTPGHAQVRIHLHYRRRLGGKGSRTVCDR